MQRWADRTALVTGASSGIGRAISKELLRLGVNVVGCARRVGQIETIAEEVPQPRGRLLAVKCDVGNTDEILAMFDQIRNSDFKGVDICVNNAGFGDKGSLSEGDIEVWRSMLNVNILGLCVCTREALKSMRERGVDDGHIIHISSTAGHKVFAAAPVYSATKFAVRALAEGLRQELAEKKSGIRVSQISPGVVRTEFREVATKKAAKAFYDSTNHLTAGDVATAVIHCLSAPKHVQTHDVIVRPVGKPEQ